MVFVITRFHCKHHSAVKIDNGVTATLAPLATLIGTEFCSSLAAAVADKTRDACKVSRIVWSWSTEGEIW
jgi:hypothetical protein